MSGVVGTAGGVGLGGRLDMGAYGGPAYRLGYSLGGGGHYPGGGDPLHSQYGLYGPVTTNSGIPIEPERQPGPLSAQGGGGGFVPQQQPQPPGMGYGYYSSEDGDISDDIDGGSGPSHSNLYVKNIPEEVSEQQLEAAFRSYGEIDSCRLVRNLKTGASRGYGFVRYFRRQDAMMAITALNGFAFGNSVLEVKFADSDAGPKSPKQVHGATPSDNLYVRNLPPSFTEGELVGLFRPYGEVVETRLLNAGTNEHGVRGMGALVRLATVDQATMAIDGINGRIAPGGSMPLMVRYADSAEDKARRHQRQLRAPRYSPYPAAAAGPTVALTPPATTAISANGSTPNETPVAASQSLSSTNSLPAGFTGFTSTGLPDTAPMESAGMPKVPSVHTRMDAVVLAGQPQTAAAAAYHGAWTQDAQAPGIVGPPTIQPAASLYVKNLPQEADKLFLYEKFAVFGAITSVKVLLDDVSGSCKGVGFVNFVEHSAAREAIHAMNGFKTGDKQLHVSLQTHRTANARGASPFQPF